MPRTTVVADHEVGGSECRCELPQTHPPARIVDAHGGCGRRIDDPLADLRAERNVLGAADEQDPRAVGHEAPRDGGETVSGPAATRIRRAGMDRHDGSAPSRFVHLILDIDARLEQRGRRPREPDHLERAQHLVLVVDVIEHALECCGIRGAGADGVTRAQREQEGIGIPPAPVELHGEVVFFGPALVDEARALARFLSLGRRRDAGKARQKNHPVRRAGRPRCTGHEEVTRGARTEQHDLGVGIGGGERGDRGLREQQVAKAPASQHRDAAHVTERLGEGREGRRGRRHTLVRSRPDRVANPIV